MRKIAIYPFRVLLGLVLLTACDSGFDELNTSKTRATALNPLYELNNAIIRSSFPNSTLVYEEAIVQQMVTPNSGVLTGGNFNQDNRPVTQSIWQRYYREVIKHTVDVLDKTRDDASRTNLYHMTRIWQAYAMMLLTDSYGDIPYTEAGLAYLETTVSPRYDSQQEIYGNILRELEEASAGLDAGAAIESGDVMYSGRVDRWKRLGYSLMLRAAMRLTKVDPGTAQSYVAKAVAGGLMTSNDDNAVVRHTALYTSDIGNVLTGSEASNYYLAAPFLNYLKTNNDPRLASIAVRYVGATGGGEQKPGDATTPSNGNTSPDVQVGMPMGYDNGSITPVVQSLGLKSFYDFSQLDRTRMGRRDAPMFLVTHAQTQLLLAEAVTRGWAPGDAAALYANGIRAHMDQLKLYGVNTAIPTAAIDAYVQANPLDPARALEQINTQYWVASFLNGPEAFANFRRSGFPALTPNPYPGRGINGQFIRRLTYPDSEKSVNSGSIQEAIDRQGEDNLETRVWWDKP